MTERVVIDPAICHGKPVLRGTHTPVATILGSLADGMTVEEVQRAYDLTPEDVRAALAFAAGLVEQILNGWSRGTGIVPSPSPPTLHDPQSLLEKEFLEDLERFRREDLERTLQEDDRECSNSSSTPTT